MQVVAKASGVIPDELQQPPIPSELTGFLPWLAQLPCPLGWQDVSAWQQVTGRRLDRWEIDLLMKLDRVRQ